MAGLKDDDLYRELWKLCAGPLVDVPRNGDRVFYFPQGHMEQVCICIWFFFSLFLCFDFVAIFGVVIVFLSLLYLHTKTLRPSGLFFFFFSSSSSSFAFVQLQASTDQELNQEIPHFNLPAKIFCRVVNIQLLVLLFLFLFAVVFSLFLFFLAEVTVHM